LKTSIASDIFSYPTNYIRGNIAIVDASLTERADDGVVSNAMTHQQQWLQDHLNMINHKFYVHVESKPLQAQATNILP
jgi:hypothetical protein